MGYPTHLRLAVGCLLQLSGESQVGYSVPGVHFMTTSNFSSDMIGWVAIASGVAGLFGLAFIILFFTIGQPFGTLNDICIAIAAILSGVLAWMIFPDGSFAHFLSPLAQ